MFTPKKSLGQHFLRDANIARNIVALLDVCESDTVLEIGPGPGALTDLLLATPARHILALEIDGRAVEELRARYAGEPRIEVIHADVLETDIAPLAASAGSPLRVLGNLPYNITSQILFHMFASHASVRDCVFMMQREVAQRIAAHPNSKEYGILSVMTRLHADARIAMPVSPNVFRPRPAVWSAVMHFTFHETQLARVRDPELLRRVVRAAFGKRRKILSNALKDIGLEAASAPAAVIPYLQARAEQLALDDFIIVTNALHDAGLRLWPAESASFPSSP